MTVLAPGHAEHIQDGESAMRLWDVSLRMVGLDAESRDASQASLADELSIRLDGSKAERILGIKYIPLEVSMKDSFEQFLCRQRRMMAE